MIILMRIAFSVPKQSIFVFTPTGSSLAFYQTRNAVDQDFLDGYYCSDSKMLDKSKV